MHRLFLFLLMMFSIAGAQTPQLPPAFVPDTSLARRLNGIVDSLGINKDYDVGEDGIEQISLALVDLSGPTPRFAGVHADNFIYPASVYKMYVAAEILHQVSTGAYSLTRPVVVRPINAVDRSREVASDPRPLLQGGDTVTVNYLLDLMITRSDNSAANCLIDLAGRENINAMLQSYGWHGSEVTRKFLKRANEDPGYEKIRSTETCALHAAEFMYRIQTRQLVNPWVSQQLQALLGRQLDNTKLATGLPPQAMFYHKTGWYAYWTHDVGIVDDGSRRYIVACFLPIPEEAALPIMKELGRRIDALISKH
jgi:beta-lactamase class A